MAMMPYAEKKVPNSKLLISNTARKVGLKTLGITNGRKKMVSPAMISVSNEIHR